MFLGSFWPSWSLPVPFHARPQHNQLKCDRGGRGGAVAEEGNRDGEPIGCEWPGSSILNFVLIMRYE